MTNCRTIKRELQRLARPAKGRDLAWFFKTGPGEYGEGDRFIGVAVPDIRRIVKQYSDGITLSSAVSLLLSPIHEERLCALLILVRKFESGDKNTRLRVYRAYLDNTRYINNWDLVDLSAPNIVGEWLHGKSKRPLIALAHSRSLWERRIAILATFSNIRRGDPKIALQIARLLLDDKHDLIHKAVGWTLREVGKRCSVGELERFLRKYGRRMPRTTLRYAIERFPKTKRLKYMRM